MKYRHVALLIIDMLKGFAAEGDAAYQQRFQEVAKRILGLKRALQAEGSTTVYLNECFDSVEAYLSSPEAKKHPPHSIRGTVEAQVVNLLTPDGTDWIVEKRVNSGFYRSSLTSHLRKAKIDTLILTGVHTHVCIMLNAVDAFYRGFEVFVPSECVTTIKLDRHAFGLGFIDRHAGKVVAIDRLPQIVLPTPVKYRG